MVAQPVNGDSSLSVVGHAALAETRQQDISIMEKVIVKGNLADLEPEERAAYYFQVCESLGLNPYTRPFDYIELDGGGGDKTLQLYAKRDCTDQLRGLKGVTVKVTSRELVDGVYIVTAQATTRDGRSDESIGAVPLVKEGGDWEDVIGKNGQKIEDGKWPNGGTRYKRKWKSDGTTTPLSPDARANAIMKAETKAKRRVTLSLCGLGLLDETELDTIASARRVNVDVVSGEFIEAEVVTTESNPVGSDIPDWTVFWRNARAAGHDPNSFNAMTGKAATDFGSPQAAWDALMEATGASPAQSHVVDVETAANPHGGGSMGDEPSASFDMEAAAWRDRVEAAHVDTDLGRSSVELANLIAEAGDDPARWDVLLAMSPTQNRLNSIRGAHIKTGAKDNQANIATYQRRTNELKAKGTAGK